MENQIDLLTNLAIYARDYVKRVGDYLNEIQQESNIKFIKDSYRERQNSDEGTDAPLIIEIASDLPEKYFSKTLKHELIHANQFEKYEITCRNLYFMELEAYTFSNLPDSVFYKIYGNI